MIAQGVEPHLGDKRAIKNHISLFVQTASAPCASRVERTPLRGFENCRSELLARNLDSLTKATTDDTDHTDKESDNNMAGGKRAPVP